MSTLLPRSLEQIQTAVDFVEDRLAQSLDAPTIASAAGLSVSRLHRLFRACVGESLMDYVRNRRLVLAAEALVQCRASVLDVALAHGFESHETFTRAFRRRFRCSPQLFRRRYSGLWHLPRKPRIDSDYLAHLYRNFSLEPEIRTLPSMRLLGLQCLFYGFGHPQSNVFEVIPPTWDRLRREGEAMRLADIRAVGAVENPDCVQQGDLHRYTAAFVDDTLEAPPGWGEWVVPAGRYACFEHQGRPTDYEKSFMYMYAVWLPQSGEESEARPELELYPPTAHYSPVTLCLPLRS